MAVTGAKENTVIAFTVCATKVDIMYPTTGNRRMWSSYREVGKII